MFSSGESFRRHFQFPRLEPVAYANLSRNFDHHARARFLRLAKVELAECRQSRSLEPRRNRRQEGGRLGSSAEIPAGKYTVILEPSAVLDIVGFMFWDYSGMAILDQRSFLTGRIGKKLFGENITIYDDVAHPLQSGSPFDGEGIRRERSRTGQKRRGETRGLRACYGREDEMLGAQRTRWARSSPPATGFPCQTRWGRFR